VGIPRAHAHERPDRGGVVLNVVGVVLITLFAALVGPHALGLVI
jgi:hypothetical protein